MNSLIITQPDDWHLHLRDGAALRTTVPHSAAHFARAVIMPNLNPPVTTLESALNYKKAILAESHGLAFKPLMTLYLTDHTDPSELKKAHDGGIIGCKLYPQGATTHSDAGITQIETLYPVLSMMEELGLLLLIHGEVVDPEVDIFDREKQFIDSVLAPLLQHFPKLKIVLEHITTAYAAHFVKEASPYLAATVTAHHLWLNRNALLSGGIRPHHYCLPILKRETDRIALLEVVTSGHPRFFLGTDSAPHAKHAKESHCGCAGIYTSFHAMALYAQIFDSMHALDKLEGFASLFGPQFYGLPINKGQLRLEKKPNLIPEKLTLGPDPLIPFLAGEQLKWTATLL